MDSPVEELRLGSTWRALTMNLMQTLDLGQYDIVMNSKGLSHFLERMMRSPENKSRYGLAERPIDASKNTLIFLLPS